MIKTITMINNEDNKGIIKTLDDTYLFAEGFNIATGTYVRTGILDENGKDTGVDPFMRSFPSLIDIGVMGHCTHGRTGMCIASGVQCYQNGYEVSQQNMSLDNFKKIIDQCKGKVFQVALGGRGDVNMHEDFEELLKYCRENFIVPNFTTSGLNFTDEDAEICKKYCGAVAVSWYRHDHSYFTIRRLIEAGVITNIHYVLGNNTIDEAINRLRTRGFPGVNAVIFLLHKPVGLGREDNILSIDNQKVKEFFELVDGGDFPFKIGFDSCSIPGVINLTKNIMKESMDTCEGARFSMYITPDMIALPCSFDQEYRWGVDLNSHSIQEAWDSEEFNDFRRHLQESCPNCQNRVECMGGCPIKPQIVLCNERR